MSSKVHMNGLTVEQRNGKTYVNGKDISQVATVKPQVSFAVTFAACAICLLIGFVAGTQI